MTEVEFTVKEIYVETVRVEARHRRDLGDIGPLAESIAQIGLIHPITVTAAGYLIAGQRRLEAHRKLGRDRIPARVITDITGAVERLRIERDENTARKPMTPEELVSLGRALEELERPGARERQQRAGRENGRGIASDQENGTYSRGAETREVVAAAIGMSPTSYQRARAVVAAATDPAATPEDRAVAGQALAEMNETGLITPAYEKIRGRRPAQTGAKPKTAGIVGPAAQRRAIGNAVNTLSGITHALKQIEAIHPDITDAEAAQWVDGLAEARQVIAALTRKLKERTNVEA
jgi:ParB-like chromosome segregation protein Spo0J